MALFRAKVPIRDTELTAAPACLQLSLVGSVLLPADQLLPFIDGLDVPGHQAKFPSRVLLPPMIGLGYAWLLRLFRVDDSLS